MVDWLVHVMNIKASTVKMLVNFLGIATDKMNRKEVCVIFFTTFHDPLSDLNPSWIEQKHRQHVSFAIFQFHNFDVIHD